MNTGTVKDCAGKYGTPFYIFDINELYSWCEKVRSVFSQNVSLCYAIKANPFLLKYMDKVINRFEVCSPGEYSICLKYNIPSEKIVLSGVYKSKENIEQAFDNDFKGIITLESASHFRLLKEVINERKIPHVKIMPRLSSGNKFGMSEDDILAILDECSGLSVFEVAGLQFFSGTQKKRTVVIERELAKIDSFCDIIKEKTGNAISLIEYGPGIFFDYYDKTDRIQSAEIISEALTPYLSKYKFIIETGRYISAPCGHYVTKIVDLKHIDGINYCLVDGGIHHVNYYGRMLGMNVPDVSHIAWDNADPADSGVVDIDTGETADSKTDDMAENNAGVDNTSVKWDVCGALCTVNDVLLRNHVLESPKENDLLMFNDTGAYSCTESGVLFLSRSMPVILALEADGNIKLLRDMIETYSFNS